MPFLKYSANSMPFHKIGLIGRHGQAEIDGNDEMKFTISNKRSFFFKKKIVPLKLYSAALASNKLLSGLRFTSL